MSWMRRPAGRAEPAAELPLPAAPPPPAERSAPGLRHALERLPRSGAAVLDLGAALAVNVAFFNRLGARRLRIADLDATLDESGLREAAPALWERALPELLPFAEGERFDLVLAWDLPNYVGRQRWTALVVRIREHLAPAGAFHLLARVGPTMPARPCRYRIVDTGTLSEDVLVAETVPAPRMPHAEVEKIHPGLVAPRSHLGKHGVQEYVLEHAAAHHLPPRAVAQPRKRPPGPAIRVPPPEPRKPGSAP